MISCYTPPKSGPLMVHVKWERGTKVKPRLSGILTFAFLLNANIVFAQTGREWESLDGRTIVAEFQSQDAESVNLLMANQKQVKVPKKQLSPSELQFLAIQEFQTQEAAQLSALNSVSYQLGKSLGKHSADLKKANNTYKQSPFAALWFGVAYCADSNEPEEGVRFFGDAMRRIETQRKVDPLRHATTLSSALNNMAVAKLKLHNSEEACKYFLRSYDLIKSGSDVVMHNILQFHKIVEMPKSSFKVDEKSLSKLLATVHEISAVPNRLQLPQGWYYSIEIDVPSPSMSNVLVEGISPPTSALELTAYGSGFVVAPGYVVTTKSSLFTNKSAPEVVTIAVPDEKSWVGKKVRNVTLTGSPFASAASNPTSITRTSGITATPFIWKGAASNTSLALLEVEDLDSPSLKIETNNLVSGQPLAVVGFVRGQGMLKNNLQFAKGEFVRSRDDGGSFFTSSKISSASRGGPCVDARFGVVGVSLETPAKHDKERCECISANEIRRWVSDDLSRSDIFNLPSKNTSGSAPSARDMIKISTLPVFSWTSRSDLSEPMFVLFNDPKTKKDRTIVDPWCFKCGGDGLVKCPNCGGSGRLEAGMNTTVVGIDPTTGGKIFQQQQAYKPCGVCSSRKRLDCPDCVDGKIR